MNHLDCSTCVIAATATWDDFRNKAISEYEGFLRAGGKAFVGFLIPNTTVDSEGHVQPSSSGDYSVIISLEGQATSIIVYEGKLEVSSTFLPRDATGWLVPSFEPMGLRDDERGTSGELSAVALAVEIAVSRLQAFGVSPIDASFVMADWVLDLD